MSALFGDSSRWRQPGHSRHRPEFPGRCGGGCRGADIRITMNIYGDVETDEMTTAVGVKVSQLAFFGGGERSAIRAQWKLSY